MYRLQRLSVRTSRSIVESVSVKSRSGLSHLSNDAKKQSEIDLQSSLLIRGYAAIKDDVRKGERVSNILHVHITNQPDDNQLVSSILKEIKARIWNVDHYFTVGTPGECEADMRVKWTSSDIDTVGTMYYCHTPAFLDDGISQHTQLLMASVKKDINNCHPELGDDWLIECFLTKQIKSCHPYTPDFALRTF